MAVQGRWRFWAVAGIRTAGLLLALAPAGCQPEPPAPDPAAQTPSSSSNPSAASSPGDAQPTLDPGLHQSFAEAISPNPPADWQPPALTLTGKSVGKLYTEVVARWDSVKFIAPSGKPLRYSATLDTELGPIELLLRPDLAPNHVRNFVTLALVGYYDGLVFERTVHARSNLPDQEGLEVELLEGGCPLGTGDAGVGSIGYWLKSEFNKEPHEVGTVGACHGEDPDSAACRFYITLSKAPWLDSHFTVFGKVTDGLDVARKIFSLPVLNDPDYPELDRPEKPVVIRKVTIHAVEDPGPAGH
jgi:cyclophilin family peptidyl-prolyl cis-trans isomerase